MQKRKLTTPFFGSILGVGTKIDYRSTATAATLTGRAWGCPQQVSGCSKPKIMARGLDINTNLTVQAYGQPLEWDSPPRKLTTLFDQKNCHFWLGDTTVKEVDEAACWDHWLSEALHLLRDSQIFSHNELLVNYTLEKERSGDILKVQWGTIGSSESGSSVSQFGASTNVKRQASWRAPYLWPLQNSWFFGRTVSCDKGTSASVHPKIKDPPACTTLAYSVCPNTTNYLCSAAEN